MPTDHSMESHATYHTWLRDPLDIMEVLDGIKNDRELITLRSTELFTITDAGYSPLDRTEPLFRIEPADKDKFFPMGFYTVKELQHRLDKM